MGSARHPDSRRSANVVVGTIARLMFGSSTCVRAGEYSGLAAYSLDTAEGAGLGSGELISLLDSASITADGSHMASCVGVATVFLGVGCGRILGGAGVATETHAGVAIGVADTEEVVGVDKGTAAAGRGA